MTFQNIGHLFENVDMIDLKWNLPRELMDRLEDALWDGEIDADLEQEIVDEVNDWKHCY